MRVDTHVHLITAKMIHDIMLRYSRERPGLLERVNHMGRPFINPDFIDFLKRTSVEDFARLWQAELDKHKVDHACFLPIHGASMPQLDEFISLDPARFSGYLFVDNPTDKSTLVKLKTYMKTGRFVGVKLYPSIQMFSVADKKMYPLYEAAAELGAAVLIHFGITHAPMVDYRYTNPLDLQAPAKMFPDTNFIIAHFGAGFFREVLLLGFHAQNVYVDTSGTNNWREYLPEVMTLERIFKRTIEVFGADRILFGTDTAINDAAGYRTFVLKEQTAALRKLRVSKKNRGLIMGGNAVRLFGLDRRPSQ